MQSYFGYILLPTSDGFKEIEGVRLFMDGDDFWIEAPLKLYGLERYNLLNGGFTGLGNVALMECDFIGVSSGVGGYEGKLSVKYILCSDHIVNESDLKFTQLSITMPSLRKWFNKRIFNEVNVLEDNVSLFKHDPISLATCNDVTFEVTFSITQGLNKETGLTVNDYVSLKIKSKDGSLPLWVLISYYTKFKKFLAFIEIFDEGDDYFTLFDDAIKYDSHNALVPMKFFRSQYKFKNNGINSIAKLKFDFHENEIQTVLNNWYSIEDLSDSIDLVLEKYFHSQLSIENFFLNSCFAIEIYHRRLKNNKRYSKAEFKKIKSEIISKIDNSDILAFFEEKLAYANEPSFRERLESLKEEFMVILPESVNFTEFIRKIVKTRNYIVHRSSNDGTMTGLELYYSSFYIEAVTKLCIFKELGYSQKKLSEMFSNTRTQIERMYSLNKNLESGINKI